jgi:hypothetical protein
VRNLERTERKPEGRELILMPQGPHGPSLGFRINGKEEMRRFDEAMSILSREERENVSLVIDVAREVGLERID